MLRVAVFASGRGSNLQALVDARARGELPQTEIALVVTNVPEVQAADRARKAGIEVAVIPHRGMGREEHETQIADLVAGRRIGLIVLAGYTRILTPGFFGMVRCPVINTHPALLPSFGGKGFYGERVHVAVLASGVRHTGVTAHYVVPEVDAGPIILQKTVPVMPSDDVASLASRVLEAEHRVLPYAVRLIAEGRVRLRDRRVEIDRYAEVIRDLELA